MKSTRPKVPTPVTSASGKAAAGLTSPSVVVIGGIDPTAGAGILADVRHLRILGARAGGAATAIVPQDLHRLRKTVYLDVGLVIEQMRSAIQVVSPQALKVSLVPTPEHATALAAEANTWRRKTGGVMVFDPVLRASVGGALSAEPGPWLEKMLAASDVVTPNRGEAVEIAASLAGGDAKRKKSPSELAAEISAKMAHDGPGAVILKSAGPATDLVLGRSGGRGSPLDELNLRGDLRDARVHGTGCAHSTGATYHLAVGESVPRAAAMAKWYVERMIDASIAASPGVRGLLMPVEPIWDPREILLQGVAAGARALEKLLDQRALPEVGTNIAYAQPLARTLDDVAALDSRIVRAGREVRSHGSPAFGVDSHMARMSLASSNVDLRMRSSCNLRYSAGLVASVKRSGLRVVELDRNLEGQGETMRWLVVQASKSGELPDGIFDRGAPGKEAMVRFLGRDPEDVCRKVAMCLRVPDLRSTKTRTAD